MMKKFYGAIIDGMYISGREGDTLRLSDNFDEFVYSEVESEVIKAIKDLRKNFPDHDIKLGTITLEVSEVE